MIRNLEHWNKRYLLSKLQQTLNDLKYWFDQSYSLTLRVDESMQIPGKEHKLWVGFTVGNDPRVQLPIEYTYVLPASGVPSCNKHDGPTADFHSGGSTQRDVATTVCLFTLCCCSALVVLAILPSIFKALTRGGQSLRLRKAIVKIAGKSPLLGVTCPNEGAAAGRVYLFKEGDIVLICPNNCKTPHHLELLDLQRTPMHAAELRS